jgi:hypothetical protein
MGLRHSRYFSLQKTHLGHIAMAKALLFCIGKGSREASYVEINLPIPILCWMDRIIPVASLVEPTITHPNGHQACLDG